VSAFTFTLPKEAAKRVEEALVPAVGLWCQKCGRITQHNEIEFRHTYPEVAGLPVQNIAATCTVCGFRDVAGFVVLLNAKGTKICERSSTEWAALPALTGTESRGKVRAKGFPKH